MKVTIKEVVNTVSEWCDSHLLISTFSTKSPSELKDVKYPLFLMYPSKIAFNNGSVQQTFAITVMDKLLADDSNEIEVSSDTAQVVEDFFLDFFDTDVEDDDELPFEIKDITEATPIVDRQPDKIAGWLYYVTVEVGSTRNQTIIPKV